jgi:hypothetical protein
MSGAPPHWQPAAQGQLDAAKRRRCALRVITLDNDGARSAGVLFQPFRTGPAHIVEFGPVAICEMSHPSTLNPRTGSILAPVWTKGDRKVVANGFIP